ncbi:MAG TPA: nucleotide sugar dehydrogenase, partial [Thermoanaerobaculia bacterium]
PRSRRGRKHDLDIESVPCTPEEFAKYDAVLLSTPHHQFKDAALYQNAKLVIDTRNVVPVAELPNTPVVRA